MASLSPCVYPVIPIVIGVIGASNIEKRFHAFTLSLSYAAGTALVYALLGIIASLSGHLFGEVASSPWSYLLFGNLCLILALWMMEWINIPLLSTQPGKIRKGHTGVFITGILSGLIISPCASPVLFGLLMYVSTTKDVFLGGAMLLAFAAGMSTLFVILGTFSGTLKTIPKPGPWMIWVKRAMALALFILAQYFLLKAGGLLL